VRYEKEGTPLLQCPGLLAESECTTVVVPRVISGIIVMRVISVMSNKFSMLLKTGLLALLELLALLALGHLGPEKCLSTRH
jgi:hypothetical protein